MRFPTTISIIFHVVLAIVVLRLPSPAAVLHKGPVEMEIRSVPRAPEPEVKKEEPKPPELKPPESEKPKPEQVVMRTPQAPTVATVTPTPKPEKPPEQAPRDLSKINLKLTALPGTDTSFAMPTQPEAHSNNTGMRTQTGAGDPLLGKMAEAKEDRFPLKPTAEGGYKYNGSRFSAEIAHDGTVAFSDKYINFDGKNAGLSFDLTDIAMRAHHEDPNRHEKMRFMEATNEVRNKLIAEARRDNMERSIARLPEHLDEIWLSSRAAKTRRQQLFAMWKDTLDVESERADGAHAARSVIEEYIRRHLPRGTDDEFTDDELTACNHGLKIPFKPYH